MKKPRKRLKKYLWVKNVKRLIRVSAMEKKKARMISMTRFLTLMIRKMTLKTIKC